ncbi:hypothetical protein [Brevundimonas sp. Root1279]|uniref:hypothetical protein n=1 Tax=Brevundimonas sp. Root1279 TaxID=1736443 RepID=UPI0006FB0DAC|nr:hypothetical protein [Brevundimonas sp. Root1279]KQW81974.1 hypothetical protein ASC65_11885 [Brevundimonas sp. Root1279]
MDQPRLQREAADRAEVYAPRPTGGAWRAALCGGVVALVAVFAVSEFYGWRMVDHLPVVVPILVASTVAAFIGYGRARRRNRRAQVAELARGPPERPPS